jgi:hypothetical protein
LEAPQGAPSGGTGCRLLRRGLEDAGGRLKK